MARLKLFLENFLVYGLGGVTSKIIPFLMLPIITKLMPNTYYYGLSDVYTVVVSFGSCIGILGMYDGMFRLFFDSEEREYRRKVSSTTLGFVLIMSAAIFLILVCNSTFFSNLFWKDDKYKSLVIMAAFNILFSSVNGIVAAPTRMNNERKVFLFSNLILPVISYGGGVFLLLQGYYVFALPLANTVATFTLVLFFLIKNRKWFSLSCFQKKFLKPLFYIAIPLFPNFIIYWIFNSSDRLMLTQMMGAEYTGIYAVGAKFGHMSQLIYSAFAGGWQYFAFSTMKDKDQVELTSKIFEYLAVISYIAAIICMILARPVLELLFAADYYEGLRIVPYLFLAPLLLMLYQTAANQFLVIKKTWPNVGILCVGAIANLLLNYIGIKTIGIEGAAIGTLIGYIVSVGICVLVLQRMHLIQINKRFYWISLILLIQFIIWRKTYYDSIFINCISAAAAILIYITLYRKEAKKFITFLKKGKQDTDT